MNRIPILRIGKVLLVTLQVDIHDELTMALQQDLSQRIVDTNAKGVLIDISALDMVDSFIARAIANISSIAGLLDAHTIVVGMQPAVAITLVELGVPMPGVQTALNMERGLSLLRRAIGDESGL